MQDLGPAALPLRSVYSLRRGTAAPSELASAAARLGYSSCVLADEGLLTGQLELASGARELGIAGAAGATVLLGGVRAVLVSRGEGWAGLCSLLTALACPERVDVEEALSLSSGLTALVDAPPAAGALRGLGFEGEVAVAVPPGELSGTPPREAVREVLAAGLRPVAAWPAMFTGEGHLEAHRVLRAGYMAIEGERPSPGDPADGRWTLPPRPVFEEAFREAPEALAGNLRLAEELRTEPGTPPGYGRRDLFEERRLTELARRRLSEVYGGSAAAARRLSTELAAIRAGGLAGYFLDFHSVVERCRREGVAVNCRGSAAGSIVAYLLGLSIVCPIRHGLSFPRFYNRLRSSPPDIDLDLDSEGRDGIVRWFLERVGRRGGAVSQVVTHRRRAALRVAAAGLGMGREEVDGLVRLLDRGRSPAWRREPAATALSLSELLLGLPSNLAPHPCGLVVAGGPLEREMPLAPSPNGLCITHFDKDGVEEMGLLKMDLLGQRGLTTVSTVCGAVGLRPADVFGKGGRLPAPARELLDSGRTIGVVHVESPAMRCLLREMRVETMEDVARALALVRPGASAGGGRRRYLERLESGGRWNPAFPELREPLRENLGVMLYQEDVSRAAAVLLGLDEAEADMLRRRLKRREVPLEEAMGMCRAAGLSPGRSRAAWELLSGYAGYGFCRAHAFTYAAVACAAAGLKQRYPAVHMAAAMASGGGFYAPSVYAAEAMRMGLRLMPPGVNTGGWTATGRDDGVMVGFRHLRGMGEREMERLESGRPYRAPVELLQAGLGRSLCRSMSAAGCLRELGMTPATAILGLEAGGGGLLSGTPSGLPELPEYSEETRVSMELGMLGFALSAHPMSLRERPAGTMPLAGLPERGRVRVWGRMACRRRLARDAGFLMLEDDSGIADAFLPSPRFAEAMTLLARPEATVVLDAVVERGLRLRVLSVGRGPLTVPASLPEAPDP